MGGFAAAQYDVEAIAQRPFRLSNIHIQLADEAVAGSLIRDRQIDRIELEERIAREIHLRNQSCRKARAEKRVVDMVRPPSVVMITPRIGARLDRGEPVPAVFVGEDAAFAAKIRVDRRVMLIRGMMVAAGCVGLPDLDDCVGDWPAIFVRNPAVDDDPLAECGFAIDHRQIGDRRKMGGAEARAGGLSDRMRHPHEAFLRVALMRAAIGRRVIGRLRPGLIWPE